MDNREPGRVPPAAEQPHGNNWSRRLREGGRWKAVAVILGLVLVLGFWIITSRSKEPGNEEEELIVSVKAARAERGSISADVAALGTIFARREATISSKIAGQIRQMALLRNKAVKEGDTIVTLESADVRAQRNEAAAALEEARTSLVSLTRGAIPQTAAQDEKAVSDARANLENARAVYERRVKLYEQGGISKKDVDASQLALTTAQNDLRLAEATARLHSTATSPGDLRIAEARVKQAEDRLAALDTQLGYAVVRAPFSGVITEQFQFQGEFAQPGGKLFTIADTSDVIVKAPIADTVAAQLKVGESARVQPQDSPGEELVGLVSLVSRAGDPQNRAVEIWVNLKNEGNRLRANSAAKVIVSTRSASDVVVVPAAAVTLEASNGDEGSVMVVDQNSIAHETKVTVGIRTNDRMEITSGLKGGETVVIEGNYSLPDGARVEVNEAGSDGKEGNGKPGSGKAESSGEKR